MRRQPTPANGCELLTRSERGELSSKCRQWDIDFSVKFEDSDIVAIATISVERAVCIPSYSIGSLFTKCVAF